MPTVVAAAAMNIQTILAKPGRAWSSEEIDMVFDWIYHTEIDHLVRFAFGFIGIPHWHAEARLELAKDVVSRKLNDAHRFLKTYDPERYRGAGCPFRNWLFVMIKRDASRKAGQEMRRYTRARLFTPPTPPPPMPYRDMERDNLLQLAQKYWPRLSPIYREAIELCRIRELSREQAARIAGCAVNAMKVRLCRAEQELRRQCKEGEAK